MNETQPNITPEMRHQGINQTAEQIGRVANLLAQRTMESPQAVSSSNYEEGELQMSRQVDEGVTVSAKRDSTDTSGPIMHNVNRITVEIKGEDGNDYEASSYYRHVPKQDKPYLRTKTKPVATGVIKQKNRETSRSIEVVGLASEEGDRSSVHTSLEEKNKLVGHSDEVRAARKAAAKVAWNMRNELVARKQRKTDAFIDKLNEF